MIKIENCIVMLLKLFQKYNVLGFELSILEAQKLAYFLQRFGEPLELNFSQSPYGPFAPNLNDLLSTLEDNFITGLKSYDNIFDEIRLKNEKLPEIDSFIMSNCSTEQKNRLEQVSNFIKGFEYSLGMEILSTVDFILQEKSDSHNNQEEIVSMIQDLTKRKKELMKPEYISIAYNRLMDYKESLYSNNLFNF